LFWPNVVAVGSLLSAFLTTFQQSTYTKIISDKNKLLEFLFLLGALLSGSTVLIGYKVCSNCNCYVWANK